jgi:hypothetical protein
MRIPGRAAPALVAASAIAVLAAGCGSSTPTAPSTTSSTTTEFFAGTLVAGGSGFYSFTVQTAGAVDVTLASLRAGSPLLDVLNTALTLGLGTPAGTGCQLDMQTQAAPALTAQLTESMASGIRCVAVSDPGVLDHAVTFVIRVVHP